MPLAWAGLHVELTSEFKGVSWGFIVGRCPWPIVLCSWNCTERREIQGGFGDKTDKRVGFALLLGCQRPSDRASKYIGQLQPNP